MKRAIIITLFVLSLVTGLKSASGQATQPVVGGTGSSQQFGNRQYRNSYDNGGGNYGGNNYGGNNFDQRGNRRERRQFAQNGGGQFAFSAPTTQSDNTPAAGAMTGDYLVLTQRSIFYPSQFLPSNLPVQAEPTRQPEDTLVFVGVFQPISNGKTPEPLMAFLEDSDSGLTTPVKVGDQIANGKVTGISLDQMDFQIKGGITEHLVVGQNLAGAQIWGSGVDSSAALPATMDFSGPSGDILKAMALRRQKELSGGK